MRLPVPFWTIGDIDISEYQKLILDLKEEKWNEWKLRQRKFIVHKSTNSIPFIWNKWDNLTKTMDVQYFNQDLSLWNAINPYLSMLSEKYRGRIVNCLFARLPSGESIKTHRDTGLHLLLINRIHLPIITNSSVKFFIDDIPYEFPPGRCFELSNDRKHAVKNMSNEDRIHLIVDLLPNYFRSFLDSSK